jgi:hypothetical protein
MRNIVIIVTGALMVLSAFAHGLLGWPAVRAIAVCYVVFGLLAMIFEAYDTHLLLFVVMGLLAAASFLVRGQQARPPEETNSLAEGLGATGTGGTPQV